MEKTSEITPPTSPSSLHLSSRFYLTCTHCRFEVVSMRVTVNDQRYKNIINNILCVNWERLTILNQKDFLTFLVIFEMLSPVKNGHRGLKESFKFLVRSFDDFFFRSYRICTILRNSERKKLLNRCLDWDWAACLLSFNLVFHFTPIFPWDIRLSMIKCL